MVQDMAGKEAEVPIGEDKRHETCSDGNHV